jgi:hypothetical protein
MKKIYFNELLVLSIPVAFAFSFPLQVLMGSPFVALIPYALGFVYLYLRPLKSGGNVLKDGVGVCELALYVYIALVFFNGTWQFVFGFIGGFEYLSSLVKFIFPVFFYFLFLECPESVVRWLRISVSLVGLVVGLYWVYDSYSSFILGAPLDFSLKAVEYSADQSGQQYQDQNLGRVTPGARTHGILERHSITAAWVAMGAFGLLSLIPASLKFLRALVLFFFLSILLIGHNWTAIISFVFVVILVEFSIINLIFRLKLSAGGVMVLFWLLIMFVACIGLVFIVYPVEFYRVYEIVAGIIEIQIAVISGDVELEGGTFFGLFLQKVISYPLDSFEYPLSLFIGEGFSSYGNMKSSDFGFLETLQMFGLPFTLVVFFGVLKLIISGLLQISRFGFCNSSGRGGVFFATAVLLYVILAEIHYSIWSAKSILPVFFICIAFLVREGRLLRRLYPR